MALQEVRLQRLRDIQQWLEGDMGSEDVFIKEHVFIWGISIDTVLEIKVDIFFIIIIC